MRNQRLGRESNGILTLTIGLLLAICLVSQGCKDKTPENAGQDPGKVVPTPEQRDGPMDFEPVVLTPPKEETPDELPTVLLTEMDQATCLLSVNDMFPASPLLQVDGRPSRPLAQYYGSKATVVAFWSTGSTPFSPIAAQKMLVDLDEDIAKEYSSLGAQVIAVNVGDPQQTVQTVQQTSGAGYSFLQDPNGDLYRQVAVERLPRVYVLNSSGAVVWFDMEYSETTREQLLQAVRFLTK
jgi:hypothetical protein